MSTFIFPMRRKSPGYSGKYAHITADILAAEIGAGKTVSQIAETLGVPRGTLSGLLKMHGLSKKRK